MSKIPPQGIWKTIRGKYDSLHMLIETSYLKKRL